MIQEEEEDLGERLQNLQFDVPNEYGETHPLWAEIDMITREELSHARQDIDTNMWLLFVETEGMKMYRRELTEARGAIDPMKAVRQVRGATAHEMTHLFWSPDVRLEWDTTVNKIRILDRPSENTLIIHQKQERVWPTPQRDIVFWSHIREIPRTDPINGDAYSTWYVCNKSTAHRDGTIDENTVRAYITVCLLCQTYIDPQPAEGEPIGRDNLLTTMTYCSIIKPGGWIPASVLRTVYKREYPKFFQKLPQYVVEKCADNPISFSGLKINEQNNQWRSR